MQPIVLRSSLKSKLSISVGLAAGLALVAPGLAHANAVEELNQELINAYRNPALHVTPPPSATDMAFLGVAMYDAANATSGLNYQPYSYTGGAVSGASTDAATYAAGYTMLERLFPTLAGTYATTLNTKLTALGLTSAVQTLSANLGAKIANDYYSARSTDGRSTAQVPYTPGSTLGDYQLTGTVKTPLWPDFGKVTPFVMTSVSQFTVAPPPAIGSAEWIKSFNDVKDHGCATCGQSADQLQYSRFWSDIANTQLPPGHWLAILDTVAGAKGLDTLETARLTAKLGTAVADAAIKVWNVKYLEGDLTWRPETAIHDCTIATCGVAGDPTWTSLWAAPPFPGYISGHSGFSAAAATILADYFGDNTAFCSQSDPNAGFASIVTRCFTSFGQAAAEAGDSRIVGGIHFSFDNTAGLAVGAQIANYDNLNAFNLVPEPASLAILASGIPALGFARRRVAAGKRPVA